MNASSIFSIAPDERFPHLSKAPIVEAVLDLRARAETKWEEPLITDALKAQLPDYPKKHSLTAFQGEITMGLDVPTQGKVTQREWSGLHVQTEDGLHIAQFKREGFMFARLRPYEDWERWTAEAKRLWKAFVAVATPAEIQRMGLRFINRIQLPPGEVSIKEYLDPSPQGPRDLPLSFNHFFHQELFGLAGYPYAVRLIRTIQPGQGADPGASGLILDIDVFTTESFEFKPEAIERRLQEMRWLKNKVFFGNVTRKLVEALE